MKLAHTNEKTPDGVKTCLVVDRVIKALTFRTVEGDGQLGRQGESIKTGSFLEEAQE